MRHRRRNWRFGLGDALLAALAALFVAQTLIDGAHAHEDHDHSAAGECAICHAVGSDDDPIALSPHPAAPGSEFVGLDAALAADGAEGLGELAPNARAPPRR